MYAFETQGFPFLFLPLKATTYYLLPLLKSLSITLIKFKITTNTYSVLVNFSDALTTIKSHENLRKYIVIYEVIIDMLPLVELVIFNHY